MRKEFVYFLLGYVSGFFIAGLFTIFWMVKFT